MFVGVSSTKKGGEGVDESIDSLKLLHFLGGYLNFTIPRRRLEKRKAKQQTDRIY